MADNKRRRKSRALAEAARPKPHDWEQVSLRYADLPSLLDNFCHAAIVKVSYGPRRELTLNLQPLIWTGNQGHYGSSIAVHFTSIAVHFSGIIDYDEVLASLSEGYKKSHELAWLRYSDDYQSKADDLYVDVAFERVELHVIIHCGNLAVTIMEHDEQA